MYVLVFLSTWLEYSNWNSSREDKLLVVLANVQCFTVFVISCLQRTLAFQPHDRLFCPKARTCFSNTWKASNSGDFQPTQTLIVSVLCSGVAGALILWMDVTSQAYFLRNLFLETSAAGLFYLRNHTHKEGYIFCLGLIHGSMFCVFLCSYGQTLKCICWKHQGASVIHGVEMPVG